MRAHLPTIIACACATVFFFSAAVPRGVVFADESTFEKTIAPAIKAYCGECHGAQDEIEGDVDLLEIRTDNLAQHTHLLHKLVDVLDKGEMPPEDEPQPEAELRTRLVATMREILSTLDSSHNEFAPTPIRRMTRFQYNNAVTDLFDLKCIVFTLPERMMREHNGYFQPASGKMPAQVMVGSRPLGKSQLIERRLGGVAAFPQDLRAEHGFDNRGDHLSLSPLLLESFLNLGQSITESPDFVPRNVGIWPTFFAEPPNGVEPAAVARERLAPFLRKAFRQPVGPEVLDRYANYVAHRLATGATFTDAMRAVSAAVISSPKFLYQYNRRGSDDGVQRINDFELASRLSFFLWGSIPDDKLLDLAAAGELGKAQVLDAQITRMLQDHKLKRFCDSFPSQWLQLDRIISSSPDPQKFPQFYFSKYRASMHMMLEPLLLFETVLIENQPITQFIDSDFSYRSPLLESLYGELAGQPSDGTPRGGQVTVVRFRRVPVTDRRSGGLITNAAVMTMTSGTERTKPITRGAWIAEVIFNDPPKPPPANVPPLKDKPTGDEAKMTLRERVAKHRERSDCRGCHAKIDPLGFALENYDAIGAWRDKYGNGRKVDMTGSLFRRHDFTNIIEFKDAILAERDRFTRAFAAHMLSFALARKLGPADQVALDEIAAVTAADEYRLQTLMRQVIMSRPFQTKTQRHGE